MIIAIEGIDGVGKTIISKILFNGLSQKYKVKLYREPGATFIGELARFLIEKADLDYVSKFLLFLLSRNELLKEIREESKNNLIILDRFSPSTIAYQGLTVDSHEKILQIENLIRKDLIPDFTFYLYNEPEICLEQQMKRDGTVYTEQTKRELIKYNNRLLESYEITFKLLNWPVVKIKTDKNQTKITNQIYNLIKEDLLKYERKTR